MRALRNLPPLLRILWDSGPLVVTWGILLRIIVAFAPLGIAAVAAWIVNGVQGRMMGQDLRPHFWWMVALEVILAVTMAALLRVIDYLDSVLADRYTHYVSIRVMDQASKLDLTTYEDPVFYDRLERARVQATDRLAMIQQMGRLLQQSVTTLAFTGLLLQSSPWLLLLMAVGLSFLSGRNPLCLPWLCQEFPSDTSQAGDGLPAAGCCQPRRGERTQVVWSERLPDGPLPSDLPKDL